MCGFLLEKGIFSCSFVPFVVQTISKSLILIVPEQSIAKSIAVVCLVVWNNGVIFAARFEALGSLKQTISRLTFRTAFSRVPEGDNEKEHYGKD